MVSAAVFDVVAALILLVIALLGACAPLLLSKYGQKAKDGGTGRSLPFVLGNMLSAGVMVSAGFVHLLGQAVVELPVLKESSFPWAPFLCGCGFLSTLLADQYADSLSEKGSGSATPSMAGLRGCHSGERSLLAPASSMIVEHEGAVLQHVAVAGAWDGTDTEPAGNAQQSAAGANGNAPALAKQASSLEMTARSPPDSPHQKSVGRSPRSISPHSHRSGHSHRSPPKRGQQQSPGRRGAQDQEDESMEQSLLPTTSQGRETSDSFMDENGGQEGAHSRSEGMARDQEPAEAADRDLGLDRSPKARQPEAHRRHRGRHRDTTVSFATAALMAVALCFHSILEGAAMGAQPDVVDILHIFIAIAAHKGLAAYALGSSLVDAKSEGPRFWSVIGAFAVATPVGILLGTLLASFASGQAAAALSALASGTFLYVAFMEVIPRELADPDKRLLKLAMLIAGFGSMSVLAIWA